MGFSISGFIDGASKGVINAAEGLAGKTIEGAEYVFDLENPDGVQSQLVQRNIKETNKLATESNEVDSLGVTSKSSNPLTANTAVDGSHQFYTDDVDSVKYKVEDKEVSVGKRPYSLFNKYSLVNYRGTPLSPEGDSSESKSKFYNKIDPNTLVNPTATRLIEITGSDDTNFGYRYSYADFALAKYYGRIPNNMMVTLRRFAFPAPDDIISPKASDAEGKVSKIGQPDIARAVTWLGESTGNNLADILQFSHGFNWKEAESQMQTLNSQNKDRTGSVGSLINGNKFLSAAFNAAEGRDAYDTAVRNANAGFDAFSETYPNHVFGPLNVIKNVLVREQGLNFTQEFTLKFEYELRELGGANPKVLMLDQMANMLALTFNNAPFWGGDVRYIGDGSVGKPLGDIAMIKEGNYSGFLKSVVSQFTGKDTGSPIKDIVEGFKDFKAEGGIGKTLNNLMGGSLLKMFNSPQGGQVVNSLLTGDPTGQWHLTLGNPLNPIAVIGNLACTDTKINFEGAMGVQDFPEKMIVEVSLKPARPRDKSEIESMFNAGRGRFYLQPNDGTADINKTNNVSAYGNNDTISKIANG